MHKLFETRTDEQIRDEAIHANLQRVQSVLWGQGAAEITSRQRRVLEILRGRQGRTRAISIGELGERLHTSPREIKSDVRDLVVTQGLAIVASRDSMSGGYYFATTAEERIEGSSAYIHEALALLERARIIRGLADMRMLLGQLALEDADA